MRPRLTILALFILSLTTNALAQQAKLEGHVFNSNGRPVSGVRVVVPGGQATTTDSKGHFLINFPSSTISGQSTRVEVTNWHVFDPMFGECWTQSVARSRESLKITIVAPGSTAAHLNRRRLGAIVGAFQKQIERQAAAVEKMQTKVAQLEFQQEKYAFLQRYEEEYGVPTTDLQAALDRWVVSKKASNGLERARQKFWEGDQKAVNAVLNSIKRITRSELIKARRDQLKWSRDYIDVLELNGIAYFEQFLFAKALTEFNELKKTFDSKVILKEDFTFDWANTRLWLGHIKIELGRRIAGPDGPRQLNDALEIFESVALTFDREQSPKEWAVCQTARGSALLNLGRRTAGAKGTQYLNDAEKAFSAALEIRRQEHGSPEWALAQNNLAIVLDEMAIRFEGIRSKESLKEAEAIFRDLLAVRNTRATAKEWFRTHNNLGIVLRKLGTRVDGGESRKYLTEAIEAHRTSMKIKTRELYPEELALAQENIAEALSELGQRIEGDEATAYLNDAVAMHKAALKVRTREELPQLWATSQGNLGNALGLLGERKYGAEQLRLWKEAATALRAALDIITPDLWPYDSAEMQISFGAALNKIGEQTEGKPGVQLLEEAETVLSAALKIFTREHLPRQWASTQNNRGLVQVSLGRRPDLSNNKDHLDKAVAIFRTNLEIFTREGSPQQWAMTQNNLTSTLVALAQLTRDAKYVIEAEKINLEVLKEPSAQTPQQRARPLVHQASIKYMKGDAPGAADSYARALEFYPDNVEVYRAAVAINHEVIFKFERAFELHQRWLARHTDDLDVMPDFAEAHFTTGRFSESRQHIARLLALPDNPVVTPSVRVALQAIDIANLLALGQEQEVSAKLDALVGEVSRQPATFQLLWSFRGTTYFTTQSKQLTRHREFLLKLFTALQETDRDKILVMLREQVKFPG